MSEDTMPSIRLGRTPQGQVVTETPDSVVPGYSSTWGSTFNLLGDPNTRYGALVSDGQIPMTIKLQMLADPVIAFAVAYISSKLVKAEYEIQCKDKKIQRFFQAMYEAFHREFILQAAMAVPLGCTGLIKQLDFATPVPQDVNARAVWRGSMTPYICTGFRQAPPKSSRPKFAKNGTFEGFVYDGITVDRIYALWLTIGRARAFGKYSGWGRLQNAYKSWWLGEFTNDQLTVHLQKFVDRAIEVGYPPGKDENGKDMRDLALAAGNDLRSGATVAVPSSVYTTEDMATGGENFSSIRKWTFELMESAENVDAFLKLFDHTDSRKAMGMLVPMQIFQFVAQSSLGGPTTADVLGQLAVDLIIEDAAEIDMHLNLYLFPQILSANFGPTAPPVRKKTTGLNEADRKELFELVKNLLNNQASDAVDQVDERPLLRQRGFRWRKKSRPRRSARPGARRRSGKQKRRRLKRRRRLQLLLWPRTSLSVATGPGGSRTRV